VNLLILDGHLARDPEIRFTADGTPVCNCCIANNRRAPKSGEQRALFLEFSVWGKRGEAFARYHAKGSPAMLIGHLEDNEWTDSRGEKRRRTKLVVTDWEFAGRSKTADEQPEPTTTEQPEAPPDTAF